MVLALAGDSTMTSCLPRPEPGGDDPIEDSSGAPSASKGASEAALRAAERARGAGALPDLRRAGARLALGATGPDEGPAGPGWVGAGLRVTGADGDVRALAIDMTGSTKGNVRWQRVIGCYGARRR